MEKRLPEAQESLLLVLSLCEPGEVKEEEEQDEGSGAGWAESGTCPHRAGSFLSLSPPFFWLMVIILMIFVAEVAAFVLGCIYRGKIKTDVHEPMVHKFMVYDGESGESSAIDNLQRELQCCGIVNYTDWIGSQWYNSSGKNNSVPLSCCKIDVSKNCTGWLSQTKILNTQGCEDKVKSVLQRALIYTMVIILIFANVKFFGMLSIFLVACKRKSDGFQPLNSEDLACQNDGQ